MKLPSCGTSVNVPPDWVKYIAAPAVPDTISVINTMSPDPTDTMSPLPSFAMPAMLDPAAEPAQARKSPPFVVILPEMSMALPLNPVDPIDGPSPTVSPFQV